MHQPILWFLVATYSRRIDSVLGDKIHLVRLPADEKESKLSFLDQAVRQGKDLPEDHIVCTPHSKMEDRIAFCATVIRLLKNMTTEEFAEQKAAGSYSERYDYDCNEKNIVYQRLERAPLRNVPMFLCKSHFIYFITSDQYAISTTFYVRQGERDDELLVFIDFIYKKNRESESIEALHNSVKLWHVVTISPDDDDFVDSEPSVPYTRQLSADLGIHFINSTEGTDDEEEEQKLKRQLSRHLSRKWSQRYSRQSSNESITRRERKSDEAGSSIEDKNTA